MRGGCEGAIRPLYPVGCKDVFGEAGGVSLGKGAYRWRGASRIEARNYSDFVQCVNSNEASISCAREQLSSNRSTAPPRPQHPAQRAIPRHKSTRQAHCEPHTRPAQNGVAVTRHEDPFAPAQQPPCCDPVPCQKAPSPTGRDDPAGHLIRCRQTRGDGRQHPATQRTRRNKNSHPT